MTRAAPPSAAGRNGVLLAISEILLVTLTVVSVAQFNRLFTDNSWVRPALLTVLFAHGTAIVMRRIGRGLMLTGLVSLVMMLLSTAWIHYWSTTTAGLPGGATRAALDNDLSNAWALFGEVKAPTEPAVGFLLMATLAIWIGAYLADWAAFRLWSSIEAFLPAMSIVIFVAFFGTDQRLKFLTGLFVAAVTAFLLVHRVAKQGLEARWLADRGHSGTSALLRVGAVLGAFGVLAAIFVGPNIPGADADPIVDWNDDGDGDSSRTVISPIVDIRGRIVDQKDIEVFTVRSNERTYWRLTSLPVFDGRIWGSRGQYSEADGQLPERYNSGTSDIAIEAEINIVALGAVWMPAPFEPKAIKGANSDAISFEPDSATLIVDKELENSNNIRYTVEAALPRFDPNVLASASADYDPDLLEIYTDLPDDFSDFAVQEAQRVTATANGPYAKALALQNYFRDNFTYDIEVGTGHTSAQVDAFLIGRRGYCEQFAGAYAAMARAIGLPARVAVGFTWGDQDPNDPSLWRVRGEHAHAWPEVFIPEVGWVSFEPTPSRGAPGAEPWTGVTPAQAGVDDPAPAPTETPVNPNDQVVPNPTTPEIFPPEANTEPLPVETVAAAEPTDRIPNWLEPILWAVLLAGLAAALYCALMFALHKSRRSKRHRSAVDNRERINAVWQDAEDALRPLGISRREIETDTEFAARAKHDGPLPGTALETLGQAHTMATFSPTDPDDDVLDRSRALQTEVQEAVDQQISTKQRIVDMLHPRNILGFS